MERYYALLTDGTLRDIGIHANWEAANEVEPQNTIWLVSGEDANQWREVLGPPTGEVVLIGHMGEAQPAFREPEESANPVSMGVQNATMNLLPPEEFSAPSLWRVYLRGFTLCTSYEALHPAVAVEQVREIHKASGLIRDSREYLAIREKGDALNSYLIEYDAAPEAMGQGATVQAYNASEACRIARWMFLIPEALTVTVRRLDR